MEYKIDLLLRAIFGKSFIKFIVTEQYLGIKSLSQILSEIIISNLKQNDNS